MPGLLPVRLRDQQRRFADHQPGTAADHQCVDGDRRARPAFHYAITALHDPIMYSAAVVPPGLTLNPTSGAISGTNFESGTFYIQLGTINPCAGD